MKRSNREINVFNMSMLDVICSALGAILILFMISIQAQKRSQASAEDWQEKYQKLEEKVKTYQEQIESQQKTLKSQQKTIKAQIKKIQAAKKKGAGAAIGMCEVKQKNVTISIYDHGSEDGDRVEVKHDKKILAKNMVIRSQPTSKTLKLDYGANYLIVKALNEGDGPPNTATLVIDPCNNGQSESFIWEMKEGQVRNISIVRK